ncbi:unnamed protein product [Rotaria sordida]|uniref:VASt domain-containing protein n=1 Tax=Rotaria sordida TaxID=392033 RepID=A0A814BTX3_9BILA|nr:unnamed protein product [Rotaria sordida]CAF1250416.1 unnamed protein product [Rotaria sordida]
MSRSSKKHVHSKQKNIQVDHDEDNNNKVILHDIINQSNKKKKKKRRRNSTLTIDHTIASVNNNIEINIQTSLTENCIIYRSKCPCDTHYNKQLIEHNYDLPVDKLFDLIFGSNEFVRTYRKAQHFFDQTETEWLINEETNYYERILDYKVPFETRLLGKSTIITREKQTRFHHVPGSHYVVETEVCNQGIKFSDTFALIIRFCLIQISSTTSNLLVTARIHYIKTVNGFIKQFIERNAFSASQDGLKDLNVRLNTLQNSSMDKHCLTNGEVTLAKSIIDHVRRISQPDIHSVHQPLSNNNTNIGSSYEDKFMYILIFLVGILSIIHIYLYYKLTHTDYLLDKLTNLLKIKTTKLKHKISVPDARICPAVRSYIH